MRKVSPGQEFILVFIGSYECAASRAPELAPAFRDAQTSLRARVAAENAEFVTVGVAVDWVVDEGLAFLKDIATFDEMSAGRSWLNSSAVPLLWGAQAGEPALPQIVLLSRRIVADPGSYRIDEERVLLRKVGLDEILQWQALGFPSADLPRLPPT